MARKKYIKRTISLPDGTRKWVYGKTKKEVEDKLIFSPHVGGITASSFKRGYKMLWENVARIEAGERPEHIVNLW